MAITIKHAKTDTIADWTQTDLDAQIALGNFPPGTVLADIVLPSDWNNDHTLSGTVPIANGGTGQTTANAAINALLPSQSSQSGKVLSTDGTNTSWIAAGGVGTVTSVTGTAPVSVATGTTTPVISMAAATGSVNGYLTSTDWTTFNSKAPATSGTSILYGNGSGGFSNVTVGSGLSFSTGTLSATGGSMVYPGAGIPNSTGSAWGTSYTTSGSGTVVALATGASLTTPIQVSYETWTGISAPTYTEGRVWYDTNSHALAYYNDVSSSTVHLGQDILVKVINNTGSTIANGAPVYITSTSSGQTYPNIALAKADVAATSAVIGLTNGSIANGAVGYVTSQGGIDGVNTGSFTVGQVLYLSPYSAGQLMNTIPPTGITVQVGVVSYVDASVGKIYVKQTTPLAVPASIITGTLGVDHGGTGQASALVAGGVMYGSSTIAMGVTAIGTSGQVLTSNGASAPTWTTPAAGTVTSVTGTSPISSSGGNTPAISISQATTSTNGYLSSTDWNTFNNKQPAGTYVTSVSATSPVTSSGGTTPTIAMPAATTSVSGYLTSTDWTTFNNKGSGTVTSVAALTLGTTGTDLSSSVATGTTTPVITLNVPTASATNRGVLSSADWTTFNSKGSGTVTSASIVSANGFAGTVATATTTPAITISTSITGILSGNGTAISAATTTGSGSVVLATSPTLVTPTLGVASATSVNKVTVTTPATGSTLTLVDGSTLATSGAFSTTLTSTATTNVTLPTTGTLSTLAGTETLTNKTLTNPTVTNYTESLVSIGTVTSSNTLSLTNGTVQTATLTASTACTFTMPTATAGKSFILLLKQAASTGNGTATFTSVKWNTGGAPTITATAGKMDILSFVADGTNWYGSYTQGYTP